MIQEPIKSWRNSFKPNSSVESSELTDYAVHSSVTKDNTCEDHTSLSSEDNGLNNETTPKANNGKYY